MSAQNPRHKISAALALAGAAVCVAGCGGGSSSSSRSSVAEVGGSVVSAETGIGAGTSVPSSTSATGASTSLSTQDAVTGKSAVSPQPSTGGGDPKALAAANTICARRSHELEYAQITGVHDLSALAKVAQHRAEIEQRALIELERLDPPQDVAGEYHKVIASSKLAMQRVEELGERARAGDVAGVRATKAKAEVGSLRLLVAAVKSGLKYCASVG